MFADPPRSLYVLLIVAVIVGGALLARRQDRRTFVPFAILLILFMGLFVTDRFVESNREEAVRRVEAMAAAATARNPNEFAGHISTRFAGAGGRTREDVLRSPAWDMLREHQVTATVWDFNREEFKQLNSDELEIGFMAKGEAQSGQMVLRYSKARFVRDPDGAWRMKSLEFFNPATKQPEPIPGYP